MVCTDCPATAEIGMTQERTALPLRCTVQAPQAAMPHPNFVPVWPSSSRKTHSKGMSSSTSTCTGRPLSWN